jgi:hypothetical protein
METNLSTLEEAISRYDLETIYSIWKFARAEGYLEEVGNIIDSYMPDLTGHFNIQANDFNELVMKYDYRLSRS